MTSKQIFEAVTIELGKVQAPTLKLYEFNYFLNQAIRQYVNKIYNIYDINQQTTDDLRVLKSTATLKPKQQTTTGNNAVDYLQKGIHLVNMPDDYLHLLNCVCVYELNDKNVCQNKEEFMVAGATKLTADSWPSIIDDVYNRPTIKHPYYYIHNRNDIYVDNTGVLTDRNSQLPSSISSGTDNLHGPNYLLWYKGLDSIKSICENPNSTVNDVFDTFSNAVESNVTIENALAILYDALPSNATMQQVYNIFLQHPAVSTTNTTNFSRTFDFDSNGDSIFEQYSVVYKPAGSRHVNTSRVQIEIRCGKSTVYKLAAVQVDYIKAPQFIKLTQEQLDSIEDISQIMEFPDYVNQEIINELVNLIMRKTNDPSLNTHLQITQSIARPTGQQQQQAAQA